MTARTRPLSFGGLLLLVLAVFTGIANAQVGTAALSGRVTDASGGVLPGTSVTLTNTQTAVVYSTVTNEEGRYAFPNVAVGTYDVATELQGFQKNLLTGLRLGVGQQAEANVQLKVGTVSENVLVTASALLVDTTTSALGARVSQTQIENLPLNGRNFDQLAWLAPGVNQVATQIAPGAGNPSFGRNASYSFAGLRPEGQAILLDGANLQGFWNRGSGSQLAGTSLGVEAIGEFQVLTSNYGAQFGGFGAVVNSVTRSGTNAFHGSAYEFHRNSVFDARNFFDGAEPPPFHRNQFGATLGGPIRHSKAFFFLNYEALKEERAVTNIGFVPNASMRAGFLPCSALDVVPAGCDRANPALVNVGVNPAIQPYLSLYPLPNGPDTGDGRARFTGVHTAPLNDYYANVRLDYTLSASDNLMGRFINDKSNLYQPPGSPIPGYGTFGDGSNQFFTIQERRVVGATLVNTASFHIMKTSQGGGPEKIGSQVPLLSFMDPTLPAGSIGGILANVGGGGLIATVQDTYTFSDAVSWVRGAHSLSFGADVSRVRSFYDPQSNMNNGGFTFNTVNQFLTARPFRYNGARPPQNNGRREFFDNRLEPYIQDDWRVASSLTLNLGLRYTYMSNPTETNGLMFAVKDPKTSKAFEQVPNVYLNNPNTKNIDPRFGFAWTPFKDEKTAIRGGVGRFSFLLAARNYVLGYAYAPPFEGKSAFSPSFPNAADQLASAPGATLHAAAYDREATPHAWQFNLSVQRELFRGAIATIGYLGSRGDDLVADAELNPPVVTSVTANGQNVRAAGSPRINPNFGTLSYLMTGFGKSRYHAVQLSLAGRTSGVQYLASYDYSYCRDNGSSSVARATDQGTGESHYITDIYNNDPMWDWGPCGFQANHSGKGSIVYQLPWQRNRLVSGWQVSLIGMARSGVPFSPFIDFDIANRPVNGSVNVRPDLVAGRDPNPVLGTPTKWFDPTAFTIATIPAGTYGTLPRNTISGPGLVDFDLSVQKETAVVGDVKLQLRAEVFNLFNHTNFGLPNASVFTSPNGIPSPTAGLITGTATSARQLQFSLKIVF